MFRSLLVVLVCVSGAQAEQPGAGISKPIVRIGAESPATRAARNNPHSDSRFLVHIRQSEAS